MGAAVADRVAAIRRFRMELARFAGEADGLRLEAHERDEARARRPAAIDAIAMAGADRLAERLIAQRPAQAAAGITLRLECSSGRSLLLRRRGPNGILPRAEAN